jgi:heme exporter protein C
MNPARHVLAPSGSIVVPTERPGRARSPRTFLAAVGVLAPRLAIFAVLLCATSLVIGYLSAPPSGPGYLYRMILIHAPAAWVSLALYVAVALCAGAGMAWRRRLPAMVAQALAPTGAMFALVAYWTGTLWERHSVRTWWDAHLTLELVILLLFVAIMMFRAAIEDHALADRVTGAIALAGLACIPVILGSWAHWPSLHRFIKATQGDPDAMAAAMAAMAAATAGFGLYAAAAGLLRLRCVILERDRRSDWVERHTGGLR